jgi:hypothetical protein
MRNEANDSWISIDNETTMELLFGGVIRKNWNDTEKISMAPAQG